ALDDKAFEKCTLKENCEPAAFLNGFLALGTATIFTLISLFYLTVSREGRHQLWHYSFRRNVQRILGVAVFASLAFIAVAGAIVLDDIIKDRGGVIAVISFLVAGNGLGALSFSALLSGGALNSQRRAKFAIIIIAFVLIILNITAAHEIAEHFLYGKNEEISPLSLSHIEPGRVIIFSVLAFFIFIGFWANLNYVSLNRMYRDRLMETFMPNLRSIRDQKIGNEATGADRTFLWQMAQRPYHLINTHVVLTSSLQARLRGRTGDSFILSPLYCGSPSTRYAPSRLLGVGDRKKGKGSMTLATATAISGAAFNPRVGPGGWDSVINNPIVFAMLSYFNLRLGCWVANPRWETKRKFAVPTFYNEGLKGVLNASFQEKARMVELTDGGHFENTGLYELVRRRSDVIILSDATADGDFNFKDLGIAIERIRVDHKVDIRFSFSDFDLTHLMPNSQDEEHYDKRYALARRGFAIAEIKYPAINDVDEKTGYLFYVKAVMTRNLPSDLYGYSGAHQEFPYQPISDQMFDESQFEAYRELGFQIADKMRKEFQSPIASLLSGKAKDALATRLCRKSSPTPSSPATCFDKYKTSMRTERGLGDRLETP
ncbi:MAG: hypothetical protein AAGJ87_08705, partial [Pseudomonadota bacterium]